MAKRVDFVKGTTESELFNLLGVPYGMLIVTGYQPLLVMDIDNYREYKDEFEKEMQFTWWEKRRVSKAMTKAGLKNLEAMFNKARLFQAPPDYLPQFHFKVCTLENCPQPLTHGRILTSAGKCMTPDGVNTLENGIIICQFVANEYEENKLDGVLLFQQMLAADMALDDEDWTKRYNALPEEERQKYEDAVREVDLPPLFGD